MNSKKLFLGIVLVALFMIYPNVLTLGLWTCVGIIGLGVYSGLKTK